MKRITLKHLEKLLLAFSFVILLPVLAFLFSFRQTQTIVTEKVNQYTRAMLEQTQMVVDNKWEQFHNIAYTLAGTPQIKNFVYATFPRKDKEYYSLWEIQKAIRPYGTDDYLEEIGVYFLRSDTIITSREVLRLQDFHKRYFGESYISFESFVQSLYTIPPEGAFLAPGIVTGNSHTETAVLPYVIPFPVGASTMNDGYLLFFVDTTKLDDLLQPVDILREGNIYLENEGEVVWKITNDETLAQAIKPMEKPYSFYREGKTITAYINSAGSGLTYRIELPSKLLFDQDDFIRSTVTLFLLMIALALAVGTITSFRTVRPLDKMMRLLSEASGAGKKKRVNEFDFLERSISSLLESNTALETTLEDHHHMLEKEFLNNLYHGEYSGQEQAAEAMIAMGISLIGEAFVVVIAAIAEGEEMVLVSDSQLQRTLGDSQLVLTKLAQLLDSKQQIKYTSLDSNKIAFLLSSPKQNHELLYRDAQEFFVTLKRAMFEEYGVFTSLFGGGAYKDILDISTSFSEALSTYEYYWDSEESKDIYWVSSIPKEGYSYQLSLSTQERLTNLVMAGKEKETAELLGKIYQENFTKSRYSKAERIQLLMELRGTLLRLYEKFKLDTTLFHIYVEDCSTGSDEVFNRIDQYFSSLCRLNNQMRTEKTTRLRQSVEVFIRENYAAPSLSLAMICSQFSIGEAALSQFFKEQTGETISQYIETLRMNTAYDLLKRKDIAIADIAIQVGYSSDKSFRRAFKRVTGITPSEYRRTMK